jgi:EAL domain-containing protein (putative c-di-GMP-specific phosphodiesterase class I)
VETDDQRLALQELQCGQAQGFLFARPQPADVAGAALGAVVRS